MLSRAQVDGMVRGELDNLFVTLADRFQLQHGGVDPGDDFKWEEQTVPAILEYVWRWYEGNQVSEFVTVVLEVPPGASEGIYQSLTLLLGEAPAWQDVTVAATHPGDLVATVHSSAGKHFRKAGPETVKLPNADDLG